MNAELSKRLVDNELSRASAMGVFDASFRISTYEYPNLIVHVISPHTTRAFQLHFEFTDYDESAPQLRPIGTDGRVLTGAEHPKRLQPQPPHLPGSPFPPHQPTGMGEFLCIAGTRDYYTHPQHLPQLTGKSWASDREGNRLAEVLWVVKSHFSNGDWG